MSWCKRVVSGILYVLVGLYMLHEINAWFDIPEIYRNSLTNECVRVISSNPDHSCTNLPKRAETFWVAPVSEDLI